MKFNALFNLKNQITEKPQTNNTSIIVKNLQTQKEVSIAEFTDLVAQGYAFSPSKFKVQPNGRITKKSEFWESQSIFCLDFDCGITPEVVKDKLIIEYKIVPNYIYTTFSDSPEKRKFRVVIFLDKVVDDNETRRIIQEGLISLFTDEQGNILADSSCKDAARYYLPGKQKIFFQAVEINRFDKVFSAAAAALITKDKGQTKKQKSNYRNSERIEQYRNFDYELVYERIKIFKEFVDGKHLPYSVIFPLATNMINIRGGEKWMKEKMKELNALGYTRYKDTDFNAIVTAKRYDYAPTRLENFSPNEEDYEYLNLIDASQFERGVVKVLCQEPKIPLKEAEERFKNELPRILKKPKGSITLIKLPTGFGKTAAIETLDKVTVAFPTNGLKKEVLNRMKVPFVISPELPQFSEDINKRLEFYYNTGLNNNAMAYISEIATGKKSFGFKDIVLAKEYLNNLKESRIGDVTLLTTHQRALHSETPHDTLIFDEDLFNSLVTIKKISINKDILPMTQNDKFHEENKKVERIGLSLYNFAKNLETACINPNKSFVFDHKDLVSYIIKNNLNNDLLAFLDSKFIWRDESNTDDIYFIVKNELPKDKNIIIMSATAPSEMYSMLFGESLEIVDIMNVQQTGNVIQKTNYSYSKMCLSKKHVQISEELDDIPVITFLQFKQYFKNAVKDMHLGNCAGYNTLNGKDFAVVGTYHLANFYYFLYATLFGESLSGRDNIMSYQLIEWNGFEFKFNTFDNPTLRKIQLSLIESELVQAIGRNRTLRNPCTTYVYSNFPLKETTEFISSRKKDMYQV